MSHREDFTDNHPGLAKTLWRIRRYLPPLNFITIHYAYFIIVCLLASVVFWGSSDPAFSISYTDSLFLVVSAMTEAGLNTVNLSMITTWQQIMLFFLILLGSVIWVSTWTVLARKHIFEKRFDEIVRAERVRRLNRRSSTVSASLPKLRHAVSFRKAQTVPASDTVWLATRKRESDYEPAPPTRDSNRPVIDEALPRTRRVLSLPQLEPGEASRTQDALAIGDATLEAPPEAPLESVSSNGHIAFVDGPHPNATSHIASSTGISNLLENIPARRNGAGKTPPEQERFNLGMPHFLLNRSSGRNGQFQELTSEEREHLGGCEYRALLTLSYAVPLYFFIWQFLGCIALGAWINNNMPETARGNGINPWWLGIFNGVSAFNNSGMSLLDANMVPFQNAYFVLITMGLMILAGNTAYPLFLRLTVWSILKLLKITTTEQAYCELKATLEFILKYPRRVYTNLFPSRPTWWLFFMLVLLNSVDWVGFELLNLGNPIIEGIPAGPRVLDGLFQALGKLLQGLHLDTIIRLIIFCLAVRSGGFYVVPISQVYIGLQVLYVIMMYISVYPVVITMRHSNVYEERSLGIYSDDQFVQSDSDPEVAAPLLSTPIPRYHTHTSTNSSHGSRGPMKPASPQNLFRRLGRSNTAAEIGRGLQHTFMTWQGVGVQASKLGHERHDPPAGSGLPRSATPGSRFNFVSQQIHGQLAHDIWWLVVAVLVITTIETSHFMADPVAFSVFNIIFEVVSAYGCVGISVGIPTADYSFCGAWHTGSKLVLCLVMIRGRHRGLPVALDRAVRLPGEQLHRDEEEDHRIRRTMTNRRLSLDAS